MKSPALPKNPSICIVLINWNQIELTCDCLDSLFAMNYSNFEVVVVDNDSKVDPTEVLQKKYKNVVVLRQAENLGFAEGNNVGFRYAYGKGFDLIMALNNDTIVDPDFIPPLIEKLQNNAEKLVAVSPKIYFKHQPDLIWAMGGKVNMLKVKGHSYHRKTPDIGQFTSDLTPDYLTGCCILIRTEILQSMDGFNKDYFAYYEDTDLSFRLREKGYQLAVVASSIIWHVAGGSSRPNKKKSPFLTFLGVRNRLMFFKTHTNGSTKAYALTYIVFSTVFSMIFHLITFRWTHAKELFRGLLTGMKYQKKSNLSE